MMGDVKASAPAQKGKLVARRGRKATGLKYESAGLPSGHEDIELAVAVRGSGGKGRDSKEGSR